MLDLFGNQSFLFLLIISVVAALGMNIVYATGQLNLGQAGFMAIGAYTTSVVDKVLDWPLALSLAAGALAAATIALPIAYGANRVRGIYLIMGTLAVGEVVRIAIANIDAVGGLQGYSGMQPISLGQATGALIVAALATTALMSSSLGLQMRGIFDDEDAAAAAGVPTRRVKVLAVVISAAVVGLAGGLMAKWLLFIAPRNFGIDLSFRIALFTLIGGVHSVLGGIVGAFLVTYLLEALRIIGANQALPAWVTVVGPWRQVIYGALVMLLMAVRPEGLVSRRWSLALVSPLRNVMRTRLTSRRSRPAATEAETPVDGSDLLEIRAVSHHFGGLQALTNVSLTIARGEILALIGANGAGKTTLNNVVSGRYRLQQGSIFLNGQDLSHLRAHERVGAGIARTFQSVRMFAHLTVAENLRLGRLASRGRSDLSEEKVLSLIGLEGKMDALPDSLTLAEQRRLEIGRAISSAPVLIFLDEPSVGMNEVERQELAQLIRCLPTMGTTVVLIDHNLDLAFSLADRVAVLDFGRLIALDRPGEVAHDPTVREAYLGTSEVAAV